MFSCSRTTDEMNDFINIFWVYYDIASMVYKGEDSGELSAFLSLKPTSS